MQKTNKELAEFYGIKVGDIVRIYSNEKHYVDYRVGLFDDIKLEPINGSWLFDPFIIADRKYEVIKPKNKRGDLFKCKDFKKCSDGCPLKGLSCNLGLVECSEDSLYEILKKTCSYYGFDTDHPIYKAFKAELDKEDE